MAEKGPRRTSRPRKQTSPPAPPGGDAEPTGSERWQRRRPSRPGKARPSRSPLESRLVVADVIARYRVSAWTVRAWLNSGALRGSVHDGRWTTTWDALFAFEGRLAPPQGPARERAKEPLLTVTDLAAYFRRKPETVRRRLRRGTLNGRRIQGEWYADREAVAAYEAAELGRRFEGSDAA